MLILLQAVLCSLWSWLLILYINKNNDTSILLAQIHDSDFFCCWISHSCFLDSERTCYRKVQISTEGRLTWETALIQLQMFHETRNPNNAHSYVLTIQESTDAVWAVPLFLATMVTWHDRIICCTSQAGSSDSNLSIHPCKHGFLLSSLFECKPSLMIWDSI